jgi:PBSX family phage terminase large subunit
MRLDPVQRDSIYLSNARMNFWDGPVRCGKSHSSLLRWIKYIQRDAPPGELYMFGKTIPALRRNIIEPMNVLLGDEMHYFVGSGRITLWNRIIWTLGANDAAAAGKVQGSTSAGTYFDEVTLYPESVFRMATSRTSVSGAKMFGTMNPNSPVHWFKKEYIDRADQLDFARFNWSLDDVTFLDPDFVRALKTEYTGLFFERFIMGRWVMAEGAIYDMFDHNDHLIESSPIEPDEYIIGVDYGTNNPTVFIIFGVKYPHNKKPIVWAEMEFYYDSKKAQKQRTDSQYAKDLKIFMDCRKHTKVPVAKIYVDPSALSFKVECQSEGIWQIADADNDVLNGIRTVSKLMSQGRYKICRRCHNLINEKPGYVWDAKKAAKGEDAPVKSNDHACDAERYALHSHFGQDSLIITTDGLNW